MSIELGYGTMIEAAHASASQLERIADALHNTKNARIDSLERRLDETLRLFAEKDRKQREVNSALRNLLCSDPGMWTRALRDNFLKAVTEALKP